MLVFTAHPTLYDLPALVDLGRRAGAKLGNELVKMINVIAVTGAQEVVLAGAIRTATADAAPGLLGTFRADIVLEKLRIFRPERPLSVYCVGIV